MKNPVATDPSTLTASDFEAMKRLAHEVRTEEAAGGQCGWVAEILSNRHGWDMHGGIYHSEDGHPIGDHIWNYHPETGTIIDATADQYGEGDTVRVLLPGDRLATRYVHADSEEQEEAWLDEARMRRNRDGAYWWVQGGVSAPEVVSYQAKESAYETGQFEF